MIVAGFGFRHEAPLASFQAAYAMTPGADAIATVAEKAPGLAPFATATGLPLISVPRNQLEDRPGSPRIRTLFGTGSVAESAALAAAGPGSILILARTRSPDGQVVIALAKGSKP